MLKFPRDLAKIVVERWEVMVSGDYTPPPCPTLVLLRNLLETCHVTASSPDEDRFPQFNVAAVPRDGFEQVFSDNSLLLFGAPRPLSTQELRRLAPVVNVKKSAILVYWKEEEWWIAGLLDLGTSWYRARVGLEYKYSVPQCLLVQIFRPGCMEVFQGNYHVATLQDGLIEGVGGVSVNLFFHSVANSGLCKLQNKIVQPIYESPREAEGFEFIALVNTYIAISSSISMEGHGGTLVLLRDSSDRISSDINLKYNCDSGVLQDAFVEFMNSRHDYCEYLALIEDSHPLPDSAVLGAELSMTDSFHSLVEVTRFVAGLSGCDGAIVLTDDLSLVGFGGEIKSEFSPNTEIREVQHEFYQDYSMCDIEQFGMRHRSAIKLASQRSNCNIVAISQDGPATGIRNDKDIVTVKKGMKLVNMNMPWA